MRHAGCEAGPPLAWKPRANGWGPKATGSSRARGLGQRQAPRKEADRRPKQWSQEAWGGRPVGGGNHGALISRGRPARGICSCWFFQGCE